MERLKRSDLERIAAERIFFTPREVASALGTSDQAVRVMARQHPEMLGGRVALIGNRVRIGARSFLDHWTTG